MNFSIDKKIMDKCKKIRILLTDVDGVLTDGGMYYSNKGEILKKFHARDGMGVNILRRNKIHTVIVTKEKTRIIRKWAKTMNVRLVLDGITKKEIGGLVKAFVLYARLPRSYWKEIEIAERVNL